MKLHPASLLLAWLSLVLVLQWLPFHLLLTLALLLFPLAFSQAGARMRQLLRRTRWLLLSIVLLFALATPGHPLTEPFDKLGLTTEGLELGILHGLRLTLLLSLLALLLERLGINALIAAIYTLLSPLGNSRHRSQMALRLLLVLEYVEQGRALRDQEKTPGWQYWLAPNHQTFDIDPARQDFPPLTLELSPLSLFDRVIMLLTLTSLATLSLIHA